MCDVLQLVETMARKRIDKILDGKKRIDTGIARVDAEANQTTDERIQAKKRSRQKRPQRLQSAPVQRPHSAPVQVPWDAEVSRLCHMTSFLLLSNSEDFIIF